MINLVVTFSKNMGIGFENKLPWNLPDDLEWFKQLTLNSIVVMGRKTWDSLPKNKRTLPNRTNVILTSSDRGHENYVSDLGDRIMFVSETELDCFITAQPAESNVFIIGGAALYAKYMATADIIYATIIDKDFKCDVFFPTEGFDTFEIDSYSTSVLEADGNIYRFITYKRITCGLAHGEYVYLDILNKLLDTGVQREDRTRTGTISLFGPQLKFDVSKSFPLLTTKFVGFKSILKELIFFLRGETDSRILEAQGVHIWHANTTRAFLDSRGLPSYNEGDMGPMYGYNWRHFGAEYFGCSHNYKAKGFDQLTSLVDGLKNDPYSRRHIITTYNPADVDKSVLAPCHGIVTQFYVEDGSINELKTLSCHTFQRSMDTFIGCPYNIASYAALLHIISKMCGMVPKYLLISTGDCHLYSTHMEQAKLQISRSPLPFPCIQVSDTLESKTFEDITIDDFTIIGYLSHPPIKAQMAI
jgi:dihydrofolate reductase/thymidylate synthase